MELVEREREGNNNKKTEEKKTWGGVSLKMLPTEMLLKRVTHRNCSRERCRPPFLKTTTNPFIYAFCSCTSISLYACHHVCACTRAKGVAHLKTSKISGSVAEWMASRLHAWFPAKGADSLQGGVTGCKKGQQRVMMMMS